VQHLARLSPVATIFLTNREVPLAMSWMCDLVAQYAYGKRFTRGDPRADRLCSRAVCPRARQGIKLYNSGSFFFDVHRPIPGSRLRSHRGRRLRHSERVIVESHPSLIGDRSFQFRDLLSVPLESRDGALRLFIQQLLNCLNKRHDAKAVLPTLRNDCARNAIDLRVFILVQPPFVRKDKALYWAQRSLDFAFRLRRDCKQTLIATRGGKRRDRSIDATWAIFAPPESADRGGAALEYGIGNQGAGRVFVDLWGDPAGGMRVPTAASSVIARLVSMNHSQRPRRTPCCATHAEAAV